MSDEFKLPNDTLTVVIRDDAPMIFCGDSPTYRSVQIKLTDEQRAAIRLALRGSSGGTDIYEEISKVFIEPEGQQT